MTNTQDSVVFGPLQRLLQVSVHHRLHLGLVLVGEARLEPASVLDLRWSMLDTDLKGAWMERNWIPLPEPVSGLLEWHLARQRLDRLRAFQWATADRVLVDERGVAFDMAAADRIVGGFWRQIGLPEIPFASLRHPCLR